MSMPFIRPRRVSYEWLCNSIEVKSYHRCLPVLRRVLTAADSLRPDACILHLCSFPPVGLTRVVSLSRVQTPGTTNHWD